MKHPFSNRLTAKSRRHGFAMVLVVIVMTATMLVAAIHQRHLSSLLQLEKAAQEAARFQNGTIAAIAEGLDLLQTGLPPTDTYACGYTITSVSETRYFRLDYARTGTQTWTVTATEVSSLTGLPTAPLAFDR
jgi:hypothetical protein